MASARGSVMPTPAPSGADFAASSIRQPVLFWAASGIFWLGLTIYIFGSWMLSPDFRPAPLGNDPVPDYVRLAVHLTEAALFIPGLWLIWKHILGPLLRTRDIPIDGLLLLNFILMWWADPMVNYLNYSFMYNGIAFNMGSWANYIPGFSYPNQGNFPEPLLLAGGIYMSWWLLTAVLGCWILRRLQESRPNLSIGWGLAAVFLVTSLMDIITEPLLTHLGVWAYPGSIHSLSIFPGTVYQWPIYEGPIVGLVCLGFTMLRYYRDDKGQMFIEKGLNRLTLSKPKKRLVTFLAIAGFAQPFFLLSYFVPYCLFTIHADTMPAYPSYLNTQICGTGTEYACPSDEWVPIPHRGVKLPVRPDDPRLPQEVRNAQSIATSGGDPFAR